MSEQLPCSLLIKRTLTVAGVEREAILTCGEDQHHIYCPAYYQKFIDNAEAALAECEARGICWPCGVVDSRTHQCATYQGEGLADGFAKAIKIESDKGHAALVELSERMAECERENADRISSLEQAQEIRVVALRNALCKVRDLERKLAECEREKACYGNMPAVLLETERKLAAAREALQAYRNFKPFDWRFDHSGAMNATQLGEHDVYLKIRAKADKVLAALTEAGERKNAPNDD